MSKLGYSSSIFKLDLAASGRGQRRLDLREELVDQDREWLGSVFGSDWSERDGPVGVVEPELDRLIDLSFLWHLPRGSGAPNFLGWTRSMVAPGRRYCATRLVNPFADCDPEMKRFLLEDRCSRLQTVCDWLQPRVTKELVARNFEGYFGIDAFVCRSSNKELKIKPVVELNPRMTMGHIASSLEKRIASGVAAEFRIYTKSEWKEVGPELEKTPLRYSGDRRWKSGVIKFCDVDDSTRLVPVLKIGC